MDDQGQGLTKEFWRCRLRITDVRLHIIKNRNSNDVFLDARPNIQLNGLPVRDSKAFRGRDLGWPTRRR